MKTLYLTVSTKPVGLQDKKFFPLCRKNAVVVGTVCNKPVKMFYEQTFPSDDLLRRLLKVMSYEYERT